MKKILGNILKILAIIFITIFSLNSLGTVLIKHNKLHFDTKPSTDTLYLPYNVNQGLLRYQFRPNYKGREWGSLFTINRFGFRGSNFNLVKSPHTIRILCLGDSCTFGTGGLYDQETYPFRLEKLLNEKQNLKNFEVINAGMPGFSVYEGLVLLKHRNLMGLKPDIVIICYGWNDHMRKEMSDKLISHQRFVNNFLNDHSACWKYLSYKWENVSKKKLCTSKKQILRVNTSEYKRYLSNMINLARSADSKVLVVTAPWEPRLIHDDIGWFKESTRESFYLHPIYVNLTKEVCKKQGIKLVNLYSIFESKKTANPSEFFNDPFHYNKNGAELIASYLSKVITENTLQP